MVVCNNGIFQVALMPFYQTILSIEYGGLSKNVVYPKLSSPIKKHADHMGLQVFLAMRHGWLAKTEKQHPP
jgi:hypothetical protein